MSKKIIRCLIALCLICAMITPIYTSAAVFSGNSTQASDYLAAYHGYIAKSGNTIQTVFSVTGTGMMEEIGAWTIDLYESTDGINYYPVHYYSFQGNSNMMAYNTGHHAGYVEHAGNANYSYKAYICVYAAGATNGDARYFWAYELY